MFKEFYDKTIVEMSPSEGNALSATLWYLTTNMSYDFGQTLFNPEPYERLTKILQCICLIINANKDFEFMVQFVEDLLKNVNHSDVNVLRESPSFMITLTRLNLIAGKAWVNKTELNTKEYSLEFQRFMFDFIASLHNDCIDFNRVFEI